MDPFLFTILGVLISVQLLTLFRHERRLSRLEVKMDMILVGFNKIGKVRRSAKG